MKSLVELKKELEELEELDFMLEMADHWDDDDYRTSRELHEKIKAKKDEISLAEMQVYGLGGI